MAVKRTQSKNQKGILTHELFTQSSKEKSNKEPLPGLSMFSLKLQQCIFHKVTGMTKGNLTTLPLHLES